MTKRKVDKQTASSREQAHAEMLKAVLARPGVNEVMQVYGNWRQKDQLLDSYRSSTKNPVRITTTNSSSGC